MCIRDSSKSAKPGQDFFPLTVDYIEKTYAAGKIPGSFFKREAKPSELETLTSRLIDRPIRPLFPEGFFNEVHVVIHTLSLNPEVDADIAANDLADWKRTVSNTLPQGKASIFIPQVETAGTNRQLGVMIAWRENERDDADSGFKDNIDATKTNDGGTFKNQGGTAAACPPGWVCHLQYISVPARCAPYAPGGGTTSYYCPGA